MGEQPYISMGNDQQAVISDDIDTERVTKKFVSLFKEYEQVLEDQYSILVENRDQILTNYQAKISEIDNFLNMRKSMIEQEEKFRQQLVEDLVD